MSTRVSHARLSEIMGGFSGDQVRVHWMKEPCVRDSATEFGTQVAVSGLLECKSRTDFRVLIAKGSYAYFKTKDITAISNLKVLTRRTSNGDVAVIYLGSHPHSDAAENERRYGSLLPDNLLITPEDVVPHEVKHQYHVIARFEDGTLQVIDKCESEDEASTVALEYSKAWPKVAVAVAEECTNV